MGGGTSVPLRAAERIDRERARELAGDAFSEDTFDRLCGADGRITADQLHTLAIALAPLQAGHAVFAAVLEADENRAYLEDAANELSAGAAAKLVRDAFVEFSLTAGDDELAARRLDSVCAAIAIIVWALELRPPHPARRVEWRRFEWLTGPAERGN